MQCNPFNGSNMNLSFTSNWYVASMYDEHWWIGVIMTVDDSNGDLDISFIYCHGPTGLISWPEWEDSCLVPFTLVLCCVLTPCTVAGHQYNLMHKDAKLIHESLRSTLEAICFGDQLILTNIVWKNLKALFSGICVTFQLILITFFNFSSNFEFK